MLRVAAQILLWSTLAFVSVNIAPAIAADSDDYVNEHNAWRAEVGAPPLIWDEDLAALAQTWANWLRDNNQCNMQHSTTLATEYAPGTMGENLYWAWTSAATLDKTPIDAVLGWGREKIDYAYGPVGDTCTEKNGPSKPIGHYTQMTWTASRKLGCAEAACTPTGGGSSGVWVCRYFPAGNVQNQYPFCGKNAPADMDKCASLLPGGRPECGEPCGTCETSADPACCSCSAEAACLTAAGTGWDCSGSTCEISDGSGSAIISAGARAGPGVMVAVVATIVVALAQLM